MSLSTRRATDPADTEAQRAARHFDVAVIISMNRQASSLTAGASEPMELEVNDYIIIKIWSDRIVFFDVKSYHRLALNTRALPVR